MWTFTRRMCDCCNTLSATPISTRHAIGFYRYFIIDTLMVNNTDRCIRVDFTPNNPQDFGFSGSIYIVDDSTYRVKKVDMGIRNEAM